MPHQTLSVLNIIWQRSDHFLRRASCESCDLIEPATAWRRGWDGRLATRLAAAPLRLPNRVRSPQTHSARKTKKGRKGPFYFSGGEGGIQLARFASSLQTCRYAAAFVEQGSKSSTHSAKIQNAPEGAFHILAERVGFEPTVRENRTPDFESGPFDHSGTSPMLRCGDEIVRR